MENSIIFLNEGILRISDQDIQIGMRASDIENQFRLHIDSYSKWTDSMGTANICFHLGKMGDFYGYKIKDISLFVCNDELWMIQVCLKIDDVDNSIIQIAKGLKEKMALPYKDIHSSNLFFQYQANEFECYLEENKYHNLNVVLKTDRYIN